MSEQIESKYDINSNDTLNVCCVAFLNRRVVYVCHSGPATVRRLGTDVTAHIEEAKSRVRQAGVDFDSIRVRFYKSDVRPDLRGKT